METTGIEPATSGLQTIKPREKSLENSMLFYALAQFATQFAMELAKIIEAWPKLPEPIQKAMLTLIDAAPRNA